MNRIFGQSIVAQEDPGVMVESVAMPKINFLEGFGFTRPVEF